MILRRLKRKDRKAVRRVSQGLALLGSGNFYDTLHISPREKDMEVFDAITQRPHMCEDAMNVVFDSARFIPKPTMEQYIDALYPQYQSKNYEHLMTTNLKIQTLFWLINGSVSPAGFEQCRDVPGFLDGYTSYLQFA